MQVVLRRTGETITPVKMFVRETGYAVSLFASFRRKNSGEDETITLHRRPDGAYEELAAPEAALDGPTRERWAINDAFGGMPKAYDPEVEVSWIETGDQWIARKD